MSRTKGPKIAEVKPAFFFPCRNSECDSAVIYRLESGRARSADRRSAECPSCGYSHSPEEIEFANSLDILEPCHVFDCPYCNSENVIIPKRHQQQDGLIGMVSKQTNRLVRVFHERREEVHHESMQPCQKCHKPVRFNVTAAIWLSYGQPCSDPDFLRAIEEKEGIRPITSKPYNAEFDIAITPSMKSF